MQSAASTDRGASSQFNRSGWLGAATLGFVALAERHSTPLRSSLFTSLFAVAFVTVVWRIARWKRVSSNEFPISNEGKSGNVS
jgi:hypothetical protein